MRRIVLASASPRRQELLRQIGLPFDVLAANVPEQERGGLSPAALACALAQEKALAASVHVWDGLVIGADTLVVLDQQVLGKPRDVAEARAMLRLLSGRTHQVITGLAVVDRQQGRTECLHVAHERTNVTFLPWSDEDIDAYVETGEPLDKAGAYAIQGYAATLISGICGCYFNVVGLPLSLLARMLRAHGVSIRPAPPQAIQASSNAPPS